MTNFPLKKLYITETNSTNSYLKEFIKEKGLFEGIALMAENQTSGRGRLGRTWQSKSGDTLCMSLAVHNIDSTGITLLSALAVYEGLAPLLRDEKLFVKWPNDIVCNNKKLAGILCERVSEYTVIGVGVNVNTLSFSKEIANKATSIRLETGEKRDVKEIFSILVASFESVFSRYDFSFDSKARRTYEDICVSLGRRVKTREHSGVAVGIAEDGALLLEIEEIFASGREKQKKILSVSSGEVTVQGIY